VLVKEYKVRDKVSADINTKIPRQQPPRDDIFGSRDPKDNLKCVPGLQKARLQYFLEEQSIKVNI
jgi:hypothetical protein